MIYVIGLGPGGRDQTTPRASAALTMCDVIVGYKAYINLIQDDYSDKELISSPMRGEVERCHLVRDLSRKGHTVGLISSGDPGVYGMAGVMLECADGEPVEIVPGMTAVDAAAAVLGAPLMHDFAIISLSDLMTPWQLIEKRLTAAAEADFVIALYNPVSHGRPDHLRHACEILMRTRGAGTPAGWVRNAGRDGQTSAVVTLGTVADAPLDMFCIVIIGSSTTRVLNGRLVTPRGYSE